MSLARAFTTRRAKAGVLVGEADSMPHRSNTTKAPGAVPLRHKISAPIQLVHTTNMLSYNAPDIPKSALSSASSTKSDEDLSDEPNYTTASSPPTSPDSPASRASISPEPNHLSCYFTPPAQKPAAATDELCPDAPVIPRRAPSHTKKASYEALTRARSTSRLSEQSTRTVSTKSSLAFSRSSSSSTNTSVSSHNSLSASHPLAAKASAPLLRTPPLRTPLTTSTTPAVPEVPATAARKYHHPFGQELAQVTEIAEEYGLRERLNLVEAEEQELAAKGLFKFTAEDYLGEIQALFSSIFLPLDPKAAPARAFVPRTNIETEAMWI